MSHLLARRAADYDLDSLLDRLRSSDCGEVDDSIPQLAEADPSQFAISLAFPDGSVRSVGDATVEFSLQSAVKPFVYALALMDDYEDVAARVGTEPTGEAFDAVRLEGDTGRPPNPMVNAGALLTASLVDGDGPDERLARIVAGSPVSRAASCGWTVTSPGRRNSTATATVRSDT
jgi:glutaminase